MEMGMGTQDYLNQLADRLDRQMTTSRLQNDPDAMDIDVAPSNEEKSPDSQNSLWADYPEPRHGEQQDDAFQLWSPSWENISPRLNETLHSHPNNKNMSTDNRRTMCGACMEMINPDNVITIDCGCHYCKSCFNGYFETGLVNRGSFPPRCCGQEISLHSVRQYLENRVVERYEDVQEEFGSRNPTYCADCGTFLPGAVIFADFKACRKCFQQTCIRCKNPRPLHQGPDKLSGTTLAATDRSRGHHCPGFTVPPEIAALIKKEEWNRCPSCQHVVEKMDGCNFMECICGTEFCYGCGMEYGTNEYCECPDNLADEEDGVDTEEEVDGDEGEEWPRFFAAVNAWGRIRCMHELTTLLNDGGDGDDNGGRCHGCLREMPEIRSCDTCQLELCSECLQ
jgi:E3 ubiquitin-protein ligase RNF144